MKRLYNKIIKNYKTIFQLLNKFCLVGEIFAFEKVRIGRVGGLILGLPTFNKMRKKKHDLYFKFYSIALYSGDLNTHNLKFRFQMEWYSNGWSLQIPDQCIRKQDDGKLSSIKIVWQSGIQMAFKYWTIWHPIFFSTIQIPNYRGDLNS